MKDRSDKFKLIYAFSLAWQIGILIIVSIGGFLLLGRWVDDFFGAGGSFFLSVGIFLGVVIAIHGVYKVLLPLIK